MRSFHKLAPTAPIDGLRRGEDDLDPRSRTPAGRKAPGRRPRLPPRSCTSSSCRRSPDAHRVTSPWRRTSPGRPGGRKYPHSLSYQEEHLRHLPPITLVDRRRRRTRPGRVEIDRHERFVHVLEDPLHRPSDAFFIAALISFRRGASGQLRRQVHQKRSGWGRGSPSRRAFLQLGMTSETALAAPVVVGIIGHPRPAPGAGPCAAGRGSSGRSCKWIVVSGRARSRRCRAAPWRPGARQFVVRRALERMKCFDGSNSSR